MQKTIGKYEIQRLLGRGTMGEVYLGIDPALGREVAIKIIQSGSTQDAEGQARFTREARAMATLNHPNIVTIFDFGTVDNDHYLAMEYLQGEDLATLIEQGRHTKAELLQALAQACEGLGYAHSRGIVHRDVKPGNIRVSTMGNRILAKLLDFGVASVDRSNLTEQGVWMGTVSYMAPEYLDTGKSAPSVDLFAIGVIIYEILSGGAKPFRGEGTTAILNAILRKDAAPIPATELAGIPPAVVAVMDKALAKDPALRFPSAEDLAQALLEALEAPLDALPGEEARPQIVVGRGGGANCLSLRVAVRQSQPGAVIIVLPGHYREAVLVDKELTFQGDGEPGNIVVESPAGPCLTVEAAGCAFSGLTLQPAEEGLAVDLHGGPTLFERCALPSLRVGGSASATLQDCALGAYGSLPALLVEPGGALTLTGSTVTHTQGLGLCLRAGAQVTAKDTQFEDTSQGSAELGPGSTAHFLRCSFLGSRFAGLLAFEGATAELEDCTFSGHEASGIHVRKDARIHLTACMIHDNPGMGVSVVDGGAAALEDCDIFENGKPGLLLHRGGTARLSHCRVVNGPSLGVACHQATRLSMDHSVVKGNALGGILLGAQAQAPELEENALEDPVLQ